MNERQLQQQKFDLSGESLVVGNIDECPLSPEQLALTTAESDYVIESFDSGLTAEVFHIRVEGRDYTLKKRRPQAKVQNPDGQYSFLNEVQRRADFKAVEHNPDFRHIVKTIYADYRLGIIVSEWIEGSHIKALNQDLLKQLFTTLLACERIGLFEWDLCAGNLLVDRDEQLMLFDFGYMYPFNSTSEFNSNGIADSLFDACERFETRFLSGWLLENDLSEEEALSIFKMVKEQALDMFQQKREWLQTSGGKTKVILHMNAVIDKYEQALVSENKLMSLFKSEMFRSHVLDIEDDLDGQSCTRTTIKRVDFVLNMLEQNYDFLLQSGSLFYQNQGKSQAELLNDYQVKRKQAIKFQL
ncbi:hypothetical protein JCM19231_4170 [Vibrio ishigakensis]|uniref:ABC1 atypical kinase-like domain-containing protein n=1 Tax=Vibrio ishigakensis TaxID=1481914 RepID=A0A0B8NY85_9VIBR|nr:AarF/UbiB family protein [Vibrio ishigakensis]GAM58906.1 hypothetical protein JCM19231_4170 [Vibrio ishigakensis]